jgi:hypothetical protein
MTEGRAGGRQIVHLADSYLKTQQHGLQSTHTDIHTNTNLYTTHTAQTDFRKIGLKRTTLRSTVILSKRKNRIPA